jgi:nucleoside 2-deoxyribosyltransferase
MSFTPCGLDAEKADDILGPGMVISDITRRLQEADVVIADISVENANVYYELGYAHALGKPAILLAEKGKALPFDISGFRTLFYENSIAGKSQIEAGLKKHLEAIVTERPI